jgi:hypothetical protein
LTVTPNAGDDTMEVCDGAPSAARTRDAAPRGDVIIELSVMSRDVSRDVEDEDEGIVCETPEGEGRGSGSAEAPRGISERDISERDFSERDISSRILCQPHQPQKDMKNGFSAAKIKEVRINIFLDPEAQHWSLQLLV